MLDFYFTYRGVLRRLRNGALGSEMDRIAEHFFRLGYKRASAKIYLGRLARFSEFAGGVEATGPITQEVVDRFLQAFPTTSPRIATATAIEHARRLAPERFSIPAPPLIVDRDATMIAAYVSYLRGVKGLEPKSCEGILLGARRFLSSFRDHFPGQGLEALNGQHVLSLVQHRLSLSTNQATRTAAISYIRTFLRFLHWSGRHDQDLARFVPGTPHWRLAHLPPRLAWEDIKRAIGAIDVTTPVGVRDRALMLLLATTGIRNKEIRTLKLLDVHWRAGEVLVRRTKGKRDRVVPLLEEAGAALADYVLQARPKVDNPHVFLTFAPPPRPFSCAGSISMIVRRRLEYGGVELMGHAGAHLLRHSLATQLVAQRRPINEVGDLLGHRSINTTAIYVKVALPQLVDVALPFPGAAS
jgi:integrase/recombinase XerD